MLHSALVHILGTKRNFRSTTTKHECAHSVTWYL